MGTVHHRWMFGLALLLGACSDYEIKDKTDTSEGLDEEPVAENVEVQVDEWDLADIDGTDLLFFGDTSGSMTAELETMGALVTEFVERLDDYDLEWRLMSVTGPDGCSTSGVLSPEDADYASLFAAGILTPPGEDEVDEWGLYNTAAAVELTDPGECNAGFLRENAALHVIFISDEDDNSPGWDQGDPNYWQQYVDQVVAKKGDADLVRYSGVVGPLPDGCDGAEPGTGYAEAAEATGGELLSICSDWPDEIDVLVDASLEYPDFELSRRPDPVSIEVEVNGALRSTGWKYVPEANAVEFEVGPPQSGDFVTVAYAVYTER